MDGLVRARRVVIRPTHQVAQTTQGTFVFEIFAKNA